MADMSSFVHDVALNRSTRSISPQRARAIIEASRKLSAILERNNQSLRISIGDWSVLVGSPWHSAPEIPELIFDDDRTCWRALRACRLYNFAKLFLDGRIQVGGPLNLLIDILYSINVENDRSQSIAEKFLLFWFRIAKELAPSFARSFESDFHYSLDARAYELFLDDYIQYTCGRVGPTTRSLEEAQVEKFRLISEWVSEQLGPINGRRHLDVGCGWGGLIFYFRNFFEADSVGLTNCATQREYILQRFGLDALLGDFTEIAQMKNQFDFVTIVGMSEHVVGGLKDKLLDNVHACLRDGGVLYFQAIAKPEQWIGGDAYRLAQEFIFPGHDLDTQIEMETRFAKAGFTIAHVEDHSADYGYTTGEWAKNVVGHFSELTALLGLRNARLFLMYLFYASKLFKEGRGKLMRYSLVKA